MKVDNPSMVGGWIFDFLPVVDVSSIVALVAVAVVVIHLELVAGWLTVDWLLVAGWCVVDRLLDAGWCTVDRLFVADSPKIAHVIPDLSTEVQVAVRDLRCLNWQHSADNRKVSVRCRQYCQSEKDLMSHCRHCHVGLAGSCCMQTLNRIKRK